MKRRHSCLLRIRDRIVWAPLLLLAFAAHAQETTAVITGIVRDAEGGKPVARVEVRSGDMTTTTSASGEYRLVVPPGATIVRTGRTTRRLTLAPGEVARVDLVYSEDIGSDAPAKVVNEQATVALPLDARTLMRLPLSRVLFGLSNIAIGNGGSQFNATPFDALGSPQSLADGTRGAFGLPLDFFDQVNLLSAAVPLEYGSDSGGIVLATTRDRGAEMRVTAFAYGSRYTSEQSAFGIDEVSRSRAWDAGVTASGAAGDRLWLAGGYDFSRVDEHIVLTELLDRQSQHAIAHSFFGKAALQATPHAYVAAEVLGNPTHTRISTSLGTYNIPYGVLVESLRGIVNDASWSGEWSASHTTYRQPGPDSRDVRLRLSAAHLAGAHLLSAGGDGERLSSIPQAAAIYAKTIARESALWLSDRWRVRPDLTLTAGLRYDNNSIRATGAVFSADAVVHHRLLMPRTQLVWLAPRGWRALVTWNRYVEGPLESVYAFSALRTDEVTAGVEWRALGARVVHRVQSSFRDPRQPDVSLRRKANGLLLTASLLPELHASYFLATGNDLAVLFGQVATRRHRLQLLATEQLGAVETGLVANWWSSARIIDTSEHAPSLTRISAHLGYAIVPRRLTVVADVFNVLNRHTPSDFSVPPVVPEPQAEPFAFLAPRSIRLGLRAAL
jgi:TonB dependent receptor